MQWESLFRITYGKPSFCKIYFKYTNWDGIKCFNMEKAVGCGIVQASSGSSGSNGF